MTKVGIVDWAIYLPKNIVTAKEIARETIVHGIDEKILIEKFGIIKKRISDSDEHVSDMCIKAAKSLLDKSGLDPLEIDLVVYNGSSSRTTTYGHAHQRCKMQLEPITLFVTISTRYV